MHKALLFLTNGRCCGQLRPQAGRCKQSSSAGWRRKPGTVDAPSPACRPRGAGLAMGLSKGLFKGAQAIAPKRCRQATACCNSSPCRATNRCSILTASNTPSGPSVWISVKGDSYRRFVGMAPCSVRCWTISAMDCSWLAQPSSGRMHQFRRLQSKFLIPEEQFNLAILNIQYFCSYESKNIGLKVFLKHQSTVFYLEILYRLLIYKNIFCSLEGS